ncbi:hypothetical protein OL229_16285 [Neisseriaceae bacterium JH1-16]|nr:hypothetical protein [Neisseriaceae bacterium JH1-16]
MPDSECCKSRTLHLARAQDTEPAARLFHPLPGFTVLALPSHRRLLISYTLPEHTLAEALQRLQLAGIALDPHPWSRWHLVLQTYSESVQLHNLAAPVSSDRRREAFSTLYQRHTHGDHDDTPEEWRQYR